METKPQSSCRAYVITFASGFRFSLAGSDANRVRMLAEKLHPREGGVESVRMPAWREDYR